MDLLVSSSIDEIISNIRARPIPFEGYQRAGLIDEADVKMIKAVDRQLPKKSEQFSAPGTRKKYAQLVLKLVQNMKKIDVVQYTLVLAGDFIAYVDGWATDLVLCGANGPHLPYAPFIALLNNEDESITLLSARVLASLIPTTEEVDSSVLEAFFSWYRAQSAKADPDLQSFATQAAASVLRTKSNRDVFWKNGANTGAVVKLLRTDGSFQLQYNALLVLWLLSFDQEVAEELNKGFEVIPLFETLARSSIKEKVTRLVVAILRNLVDLAPEQNVNPMLVGKLLPLINTLQTRKWSDQEIIEDLDHLSTVLKESLENLTSFDEYRTEVESGHLTWSPAHKSSEFWKENAANLTKDDNALVRSLARLLSTSKDPVVLAVAANDIGAFVKHYPEGRNVAQKVGAKTRVMELMANADPDVRFEALNAVQNLLSRAWEK